MSTTHTARTATSLTLLSAIALLAGCDHAPAPTSRTLVEGSVSSFLKHWNAQDAKALSTLFAEDGVRVVSSNQLPVYGRDAICKQFEDAFADGSPFEGATLSAAVLSTRDLPGDLVIGDGTFEVKGNNGDSLLTGKWGNIFRVHAGQIHLVMESAHADIPLDADRSAYAKAAREPAPKVDNSGAKELLPAFQRSADRYITAVGEMSPKLLAAEFMADGVRVVSSSAAACRGTAEITQAATSEFAKGSPFEKTTLSVTTLGVRSVGPDIAIANGLWQVKDAKGKVVEFGQWGNVMQVLEDGEMKFIMESAGGFVGLDQPSKK